ncbi:hypothetical protein P3X46_004309 [Hevea brasiliensis]|uniref:Mal d 1-associated protein n=1 Tax=Hevea brasiliensis TaxID=3981 RepID=A0ABQ9MWC3_HEVBR|nr:fra a 1-associated protein [Hevea brasiliensis]KAJ9184597.1 hypothetical protein P3X46_004309 [Hevea brasiliensis]
MGWVWRDDEPAGENEISEYWKSPDSSSGKVCSTRKVVKSQCKTEEVEPGKFVRKCEKTEEILRECLGEPAEVLRSNKEYTEDDVTDLVVKGSSSVGQFDSSPFGLPGLRSDIEGIERQFLGGINRFFEAAEQIKGSFFDVFGDLHKENPSCPPSMRRGIPIDDYPQKREASPKQREPDAGDVDLAGLARDV